LATPYTCTQDSISEKHAPSALPGQGFRGGEVTGGEILQEEEENRRDERQRKIYIKKSKRLNVPEKRIYFGKKRY
jgi:hypothetical protein